MKLRSSESSVVGGRMGGVEGGESMVRMCCLKEKLKKKTLRSFDKRDSF